MTAVRRPDPPADDQRKRLIGLFVQRTLDDVEQMRRDVPQLIAGDVAAWQDLRIAAQRAAAFARSLELGALGARAADLAAFADEKLSGAPLDTQLLMATTTAIETLAIELNRLSGEVR